MPDAFDPYRKWLGIPAAEQPANHYRLLGTALFEDDPDVIESAADQRMAHVRAFQTGAHSAASQRILNELAAARLCLLNPASRQAYDDELRRQVTSVPVAVTIAEPSSAMRVTERPLPRSSRPRRRHLGPAALAWMALAAVAIPAVIFVGYLISTKGGQAVAVAQPKEPPPAQPNSPPAQKNPLPAEQNPLPARRAPSKRDPLPGPVKDADPPEPVKEESPRPIPPPATSSDPSNGAGSSASQPHSAEVVHSDPASNSSPPSFNQSIANDPLGVTGSSSGPIPIGPLSGKALAFDGKSSFIQVPSSPSLDSEVLTRTATLESWIYLNELPFAAKRPMSIIGKSKYGNDMDLQVEPDNKVHFYIGIGGSDGHIVSNTSLESGRWYHVAAVFRAGQPGLLQLFINGTLDSSRSRKCSRATNPNPLTIGWNRVFPGRYFNGQIADTSVWSAVRSQSEIRADMRAIPNNASGLVAYWPLNLPGDGNGMTLHDATANHNDGSLGNGVAANAPTWVSPARNDTAGTPVATSPRRESKEKAGAGKTRSLGDLATDEKANNQKLTAAEAFSLKRHEGAVIRVAFHRTKPLLASAGKDGRVLLWDLQTRAPLELHKFGEEVWAVKFHPGGDYLAFANRQWWGSRMLFKTLAGQQLNEIKDFKNPGGEVLTIAYSHDGRLLAAGQVDGTIRLWDVAQFREIPPVAFGGGHNINALAFGTDTVDRKSKRTEYRLASGGHDGLVRILMATFDGKNGQWTFQPSNVQFEMGRGVLGLRFSPNGNLVGCTHGGGRVSLCDPITGKLIRNLADGGGFAWWIAFHPQRPWCVSAHGDPQVARIWNTETAELLCELKGHTGGVMCAEFSPDGRQVATASEDLSIKLWNLAGPGVPGAPDHRKKPRATLPIVGD